MKFAKGLACAGLLLIVPIILFGQDWERFKASQSLPNDDVAAFLERLCKQSGKPSIHSIAWTASASTRKVAVEEFSYYSKEKAVLYERKNVPVENFNIDTGKYSGAITEHGELYTPDGIFVRSPIISELTACTSNGILLRNTPDSYEYRRAFYKNAAYPKQILEHLSPKSMRGFIYMREAIKYMLKQGCGDEGTLAQISKAEDELVKRGKFEGRIGNFDIKAFLTDNGCIESFRLYNADSKMTFVVKNEFNDDKFADRNIKNKDVFAQKNLKGLKLPFDLKLEKMSGKNYLVPRSNYSAYLYGADNYKGLTKTPVASVNGVCADAITNAEFQSMANSSDFLNIELEGGKKIKLEKFDAYDRELAIGAHQVNFDVNLLFKPEAR